MRGRAKAASTSCDSSDHREEAIGRASDQTHLPDVCQERGMQPWADVRELSEVSFQRHRGGGNDSMKGSSTCFLERGEAADGLKGYLHVAMEERVMKREDRTRRAVRYVAGCSAVVTS